MRVLELHASMRTVKRADGRSAVGASAYITRTAMQDERTGQTFDYRAKGGVERTGIFLQEDAPEWATDRRRLWNSLERANKRRDAQVCREIEISLPHEFTPEMRNEATMKIAAALIRRYGGAVEYAIHAPDTDNGSDIRNWHSHLVFSARRFDEKGQWAAKSRKVDPEHLPEGYDRTKGPQFVRECPLDDVKRGPVEVENLRAEIAAIQNDLAARHQLPVYVEHLSYERRGIDREAQQHMGSRAVAAERKGEVTEIGTRNRQAADRNTDREATRQEIKVLQIDEAKARLDAKRGQQPRTQEEVYAEFYQQTYARRMSMVMAFEALHGQNEKNLKAEAARLTKDIEGAGFFTRWTRRAMSAIGWTPKEQQQLTDIQSKIDLLARQRSIEWNRFEQDRQQRLEVLKAEQARQAQEQLQAQALPRAVGETPRPSMKDAYLRSLGAEPQARAPQQVQEPAPFPAPASGGGAKAAYLRSLQTPEPEPKAAPAPEQKEKKPFVRKDARGAHFQKQGAQRKATREAAEQTNEPARSFEEAAHSPTPPPTQEQPQSPKNAYLASLKETYNRSAENSEAEPDADTGADFDSDLSQDLE